MRRYMRACLICSSLAIAGAAPAFAQGQEAPRFVGVGVFATPEFDGAEDLQAVPLIVAQFELVGVGVEINGVTAAFDVVGGDRFSAGPLANLRFGRDDEAGDDAIFDQLEEIDDAFEIGVFAAYKTPLSGLREGGIEARVEYKQDIGDAHEGFLITPSIGVNFAASDELQLGFGLEANYADDSYVETYFGISDVDALATGLPEYEAEAGFKDVGVSATFSYSFNPRWGLIGIASYNRLIGDAEDSPLIEAVGEVDQFAFGLGVSYAF